MTKRVTQLGGLAIASLVAATGYAQTETPQYVKVSDVHIKPSGYIVGSYQYRKTDSDSTTTTAPGGTANNPGFPKKLSNDRFDLDTAKMLFAVDYKPVTGTFSLFYDGDNEVYLLDAFATYDLGDGASITGGKFLSYLGYEAFDIPNMAQITYAYAGFNPVPAYHTGLKYNVTKGDLSWGVALVDSLYSTIAKYKGDGSLRVDWASEAFVSYTGIKNLTVWAGIGYQSEDDENFTFDNDGINGITTIYNLWSSYVVEKSTIAGEFIYTTIDNKAGSADQTGLNLLGFYSYQVDDKVATAFRFGYDSLETDRQQLSPTSYTESETTAFRLTFAPSYKISDNLKIVGELSYSSVEAESTSVAGASRTTVNNDSDEIFLGFQARFTF